MSTSYTVWRRPEGERMAVVARVASLTLAVDHALPEAADSLTIITDRHGQRCVEAKGARAWGPHSGHWVDAVEALLRARVLQALAEEPLRSAELRRRVLTEAQVGRGRADLGRLARANDLATILRRLQAEGRITREPDANRRGTRTWRLSGAPRTT